MRSAEEQIASTGSNSGGFLDFYWSCRGGAVVGVFLKEQEGQPLARRAKQHAVSSIGEVSSATLGERTSQGSAVFDLGRTKSTGWCDDNHADVWVVHHNTKQLKFTP
jgi:hypothetical protein